MKFVRLRAETSDDCSENKKNIKDKKMCQKNQT